MADGVRRGGRGTELPARRGAAVRRPARDQPADHEPGKGSRRQAVRPEQPLGPAHRRRRRVPGAVPARPSARWRTPGCWPGTRAPANTARIRVGFNAGFATDHLVALVRVLRRDHPHLELAIDNSRANSGHPQDAPRQDAGHRAGRRPGNGARAREREISDDPARRAAAGTRTRSRSRDGARSRRSRTSTSCCSSPLRAGRSGGWSRTRSTRPACTPRDHHRADGMTMLALSARASGSASAR